MKYLLDANVFLRAYHDYYPFDLAMPYWDWLLSARDDDRVFSLDVVNQELLDEELSNWTAGLGQKLFLSTAEADFLSSSTQISDWVENHPNYTIKAKNKFLRKRADMYLIAYALRFGHSVVTLEKSAPNEFGRIQIPDVCVAHNVKFITPIEMLRNEGFKFTGCKPLDPRNNLL